MAYLNRLREWRARGTAWRDHLMLGCLLCRSRTPGGLCQPCREKVCASMAPSVRRCPRCAGRLSECGLAPCPDCSQIDPALLRVVAAFDYDWPGELLIQALKLRGQFSCAPVLAGLLAARCGALQCEPDTWVTAVPAGRQALIRRGFNPAGEIGRALAARLGLAWRPGLLTRVEEGPEQKSLGRRERREQVRGLYRCRADVTGRHLLVVDDVMTTGSTLSAIAEALQAQGASAVWAAVVARTPARSQPRAHGG
ncbi:MAG TPA: ComF family protein [Burkholderiaceae bacterium]|nr:ComF family protein [Burkholderiaceae bacterium]